jgi:hypothetical protein
MCIYVQEFDWNPSCMILKYLRSFTSMLVASFYALRIRYKSSDVCHSRE